eukprot:GHVP01063307.1.p1 GENE.GHVP01063307.1~~GHVP01063307.1.p1  ORF type:complete len:123 (+),score=10.02 GHVP01063307.1:96-464(+)
MIFLIPKYSTGAHFTALFQTPNIFTLSSPLLVSDNVNQKGDISLEELFATILAFSYFIENQGLDSSVNHDKNITNDNYMAIKLGIQEELESKLFLMHVIKLIVLEMSVKYNLLWFVLICKLR